MSFIDRLANKEDKKPKKYFLINNLIIPKKYGNVSKSIQKKYTFLIELEHTKPFYIGTSIFYIEE